MLTLVAWGYAICFAVVIPFHIAMALGAPWGHLTMGGKYQGQLKGRQRLLPVISALILLLLIVSVLDRAGILALGWPHWIFAVTGVVTVLTMVANLMTPSKPERVLWGPVTVFATLFYAGVAVLS